VTAASCQPPVGIGILATGTIASAFVADLAHLPDATAVAVGSRRQDNADAFARRHGIASAHGSYEQLLEDDAVEVVYVATPHALHEQNVLDCLDAGKAVLCEKPLGVTAAQAERMVAAARARGLFLAEAMWMRCNPTLRRMVDGVRAGWVGDVSTVCADLCRSSGRATPRAGCTIRHSGRARCSTWASIRSRSLPGCSANRPRSSAPRRSTNTVSTTALRSR